MKKITQSEFDNMVASDHIRKIEGYEIYYISRCGDVITTNYMAKGYKKYMKSANHRGYRSISLCKDKSKKHHLVHRLVAKAFIENTHEHDEVNHKNEIKHDNRVENLEWCSRIYNVNYGSRTYKMARTLCKRVAKLDKAGVVVKIYDSTIETIKDGYYCSHVGACANGNRKTHGGYRWMYV